MMHWLRSTTTIGVQHLRSTTTVLQCPQRSVTIGRKVCQSIAFIGPNRIKSMQRSTLMLRMDNQNKRRFV